DTWDPTAHRTPLMFSVVNPNPAVISALLKAGANANLKDRDGHTALDYARQNPKLKGTQALLDLQRATR
ncbi:MAG: ankyrin repeat domain-containing protein, partial [Spirochaetia bacterium]